LPTLASTGTSPTRQVPRNMSASVNAGASSGSFQGLVEKGGFTLIGFPQKNGGQIPIFLKNAWLIFGQASVYVNKTQAMECFHTCRFHRSLLKLVS
jgi:hypothetical protein